MATGGGGYVATGGIPNAFGQQPIPAPPPGYTRDPNTGKLIPIAGSATDVLEQRARQQKIDDEARGRTIAYTQEDRAARDALRSRLMGLLDRPLETATYDASGAGGFFSGQGGQFEIPASIGTIEMPDTSAAQANIFARAKDKVGLQTAGSLTALRSALAGRGMLGGGAEVRGAQNILTAGQGQLGETTREQAIQEAGRLSDFAKTGYEGAIAQRGQDVSMRGQNISAANAAADRAAAVADRKAAANQRRYDSVTGLLGKLY